MKKYRYGKYIDEYFNLIDLGEIIICEDMELSIDLVKDTLDLPNVILKHDMIETCIEKIHEYFPFKLLPWEKYIISLIHAYYDDNTLVWNEFFLLMGRGAGKNGFISAVTWYLTTNLHGVRTYNVDIVANSEKQAKTSFEDVYDVIYNNKKLQKAFSYTKEKIICKKTNSYLTFNTSNAKTKDGLRPACVVYDEIHEYENYDQIKVFTSGLGKKPHSRTFYISTNGYVREGVLDDYLALSKKILNRENTKIRMLPIIFRLDKEEEVDDKKMWEKPNPSYKYFKDLQIQMEQEYEKMQEQKAIRLEFMTKRMNLPAQDSFTVVAEYDQIKATNRPIPDLKGASCMGAVDYASVRDFVSCGLLFKHGNDRVFIQHTFICHKALKLKNREFKFDIAEAKRQGLCTIVNEDSIKPDVLAKWFLEQATKYNIIDIVCDSYRKLLLEESFTSVGLPLSQVRNGTITHTLLNPLIEDIFASKSIIFGDDMLMRWYTGNVYVDTDKKGNKTYLKIEPILRKTDGFFAFIHALSRDKDIPKYAPLVDLGCWNY